MNQSIFAATGHHVGQIFFHRAAELGDRTFIKLQKGECFEEITWHAFAAMVSHALLGLCALGILPGDTVAIIGEIV